MYTYIQAYICIYVYMFTRMRTHAHPHHCVVLAYISSHGVNICRDKLKN